jgi:tetratricopeptide (TPR) repeat protein
MASPSNKKRNETKRSSATLTPQQRRLFLIVTILFPFLLLIFLEIGLRIFLYGKEYDLVTITTVNRKEFYNINPIVGKRYFDPNKYFVPQIYSGKFEIIKSKNTFRIFVLGESTPAGFPYQYNATPTRILQKQLEILYPQKNIEIINVGLTGTNSYTVLDFVDELIQYQPNAFIVYSGQNEFYGALGAASTNSIGSTRWIIRLYQTLQNVKTFKLLEKGLSSAAQFLFDSNSYSGTLMQQLASDKAIQFRSSVYVSAVEAYDKNISQVVQIAKQNDIPIILSTLVTNEGSLPPFVSLHDASVNDQKKKENESLLESAIDLQQKKQFVQAIDRYKQIIAVDSGWAIAQFHLGKCYEQIGKYDSAFIALSKARDYDGLRFRASGEVNAIIRRIASSNGGSIADVESTFRANSPNKIIGESLLWEHVHPTFTGYVLLAKSWLEGLKASSALTVEDKKLSQQFIPDSVLVDKLKITSLDLEIGVMTMSGLLRRWPFTNDPYVEAVPKNNVQQVAQKFVKGKLRWSEAHYEMAEAYLNEKDIFNALNEYESVIAMAPMDPMPFILKGDLLSAVQEYEEAEKNYFQGLSLQENSVTRLKLGVNYLKGQLYDKAIEQFSQAISGTNGSNIPLSSAQVDDAQFYSAVALFKSGKIDEAEIVLNGLLQQNSNNERAIRLLQEIQSLSRLRK